jgi:FkbM family methyltransferase
MSVSRHELLVVSMVALFGAAAAGGADWARDASVELLLLASKSISLAQTNLRSDLRDGFVGPDKILIGREVRAWEQGCRVVRRDGDLLLWSSGAGQFWLRSIEGPSSLADIAQVTQVGIYRHDGKGVQKGDVVIDCGAHVGAFIRHALDQGADKVLAIEPVSGNVECIRRTFASEIETGRVVLQQLAVFDSEGEMWVTASDRMDAHLVGANSRPTGGERVRVTTIDRLVEELQLGRIDFIKMDIEGAEREAIVGAQATIRKWRPSLAIAVEHTLDRRENCREVIRRTKQIESAYRVGYGRYQCPMWGVCSPMEIFFY